MSKGFWVVLLLIALGLLFLGILGNIEKQTGCNPSETISGTC